MKPVNQKAWLLILPVVLCVAFSAILPLMTVVNYSVQDIISPERRVFVGTDQLVRARLSTEQAIPKIGDAVWLSIVGSHTCFYKDEELIA